MTTAKGSTWDKETHCELDDIASKKYKKKAGAGGGQRILIRSTN